MEPPLYRHCCYNIGLLESVCETFTDLNDLARGEPMNNIFMDNIPDDINQGTPSQGILMLFLSSETLVSL
jgi:hypothetical protein